MREFAAALDSPEWSERRSPALDSCRAGTAEMIAMMEGGAGWTDRNRARLSAIPREWSGAGAGDDPELTGEALAAAIRTIFAGPFLPRLSSPDREPEPTGDYDAADRIDMEL